MALDRALASGLGTTNPCPIDVHMEPYSTSAIEGSLSRVFATTTKICTRGGSRPAHAEPFHAHPRAPLLAGASRPLPVYRGPVVPRRSSVGRMLERHAILRASCFGR